MAKWSTESFLRVYFFPQKEDLFVKTHPQIETLQSSETNSIKLCLLDKIVKSVLETKSILKNDHLEIAF